jgi:hypothetical protein
MQWNSSPFSGPDERRLFGKDAPDARARIILLTAQALMAYDIIMKTTIAAPIEYGKGRIDEIARLNAKPTAIQITCWIRKALCWFILSTTVHTMLVHRKNE